MKYSTGLDPQFVESFRGQRVPWGQVGYIVYKRTYSRGEEWFETVARVCNGLVEIGGLFTQAELESLYGHIFHLRGTVAGRGLWQLGTKTVRRVGADSLQNCWFVACNDPEAFCFTFNQLMLGGGVGFSILPEHVYEITKVSFDPVVQRVDEPDCDFIVPDNREGWVELLREVLKSFFRTGESLRYSTQLVRPAGRPILSFGGTASGSEPLVRGIDQICKVIRARVGLKLRPIDCLDIMNIIGTIVVAGNVRRSSQIALGDINDPLFLKAKNWSAGSIPNWRVASNNSVITESAALPDDFWCGYQGGSEPYGLVNLLNCRRYGRLADGIDYRPDYDVEGVNPCAEIVLESRAPCCLGEIFLPNIKTIEQFKEVAFLVYKALKTISCVEHSDPITQEIVSRNHRLGLGITGFLASKWQNAQKLTEVYRHVEAADIHYSQELRVGRSIKLTTCKPSGTLSLLPDNCTPGMHPAYSQHLIRRIRFSASDPLVDLARKHGYPVEPRLELDGSQDHETMVVSFPMRFKKGVKTQSEMSVIDSLETQKFLQTHWSDNAVSATHYYRPEELPDIKEWLRDNYESSVKTCSFLLAQGHGFAQAPLEPITEEQYQEIVSKTTSIDHVEGEEMIDGLECAGGGCAVR